MRRSGRRKRWDRQRLGGRPSARRVRHGTRRAPRRHRGDRVRSRHAQTLQQDQVEAITRDTISYQMALVAIAEGLKRLQAAGRPSAEAKRPIVDRLTDEDSALREAALFDLLRIVPFEA